jgi:hypothetical protein
MKLVSVFVLVISVVVFSGCGGDNSSDKCNQLKSLVTDCYDGWCAGEGANSAYCGCWQQGKDLNVNDCSCIPLNLNPLCDFVDLDNWNGQYDCSAATSIVAGYCVQ